MRIKREEAYLTVYASLSMAVLVSLFVALLESARYHTLQLEAALITDIATDSILAEYHRGMWERYGMFWMDTSYGTTEPSMQKVRMHFMNYLEKNCDMNDVFLGGYLYRDLLAMQVESADILAAALATDCNGAVFRNRAVEVVKNEVGIGILQRVAEWLTVVEHNGLDQSNLKEEISHMNEQLADFDGTVKRIGEDWVTIQVENPASGAEEIRRKGLLQFVVPDGKAISLACVDTDTLISTRRNTAGLNQGNWNLEDINEDSLPKRLMWQEYLLRYCGFYSEERVDSVLQYQIEYLIAGKENDMENLKSVVNRICTIREVANLMYLVTDKVKCAEIEAAAMLIATALTIPEAQEVFEAAIMIGWAYVESIHDIKCLLAEEEVPLLKTKQNWYCGINCVLEGADNLPEADSKDNDGESGLSYKDYLRILLALSPLEIQTFRMLDIVEMDIRNTPGNTNFRIDGCIDRVVVQAVIGSKYGYCTKISKSKQY